MPKILLSAVNIGFCNLLFKVNILRFCLFYITVNWMILGFVYFFKNILGFSLFSDVLLTKRLIDESRKCLTIDRCCPKICEHVCLYCIKSDHLSRTPFYLFNHLYILLTHFHLLCYQLICWMFLTKRTKSYWNCLWLLLLRYLHQQAARTLKINVKSLEKYRLFEQSVEKQYGCLLLDPTGFLNILWELFGESWVGLTSDPSGRVPTGSIHSTMKKKARRSQGAGGGGQEECEWSAASEHLTAFHTISIINQSINDCRHQSRCQKQKQKSNWAAQRSEFIVHKGYQQFIAVCNELFHR